MPLQILRIITYICICICADFSNVVKVVCVHTRIHTCIRTYIHTYIHTYICTRTEKHMVHTCMACWFGMFWPNFGQTWGLL
jgi:hypothetical protein